MRLAWQFSYRCAHEEPLGHVKDLIWGDIHVRTCNKHPLRISNTTTCIAACRSFNLNYAFHQYHLSDMQEVHFVNSGTITIQHFQLGLVVRKPAFCICENKDADQLRSNCAADQRLCFRYTDCTIPLLSKSQISSL